MSDFKVGDKFLNTNKITNRKNPIITIEGMTTASLGKAILKSRGITPMRQCEDVFSLSDGFVAPKSMLMYEIEHKSLIKFETPRELIKAMLDSNYLFALVLRENYSFFLCDETNIDELNFDDYFVISKETGKKIADFVNGEVVLENENDIS